jgi:Leucine-rich repeat (LRR) protein
MLFAVLSMHKRLKVFRASGEREDIRGHLRSFPWDILEAEVNRQNRSPSLPSGLANTPPPFLPCRLLTLTVGQVLGFASLQKLDLSYNSLTGPISPYISTILPSLKLLNLDDNGLLGHLPPDLGNLTHLEYLILSRNEFEGPIPSSLGNLIHLKDLQLWRNKLTGPPPLSSPLLHDHGLTGSIPPSFGNLKSLLRMNIDSCMLSGPIPEELGNLTTLRELYCFDNRLSGYLSPALFGMVNLQYLGLNGNQLTGPIPNEIG